MEDFVHDPSIDREAIAGGAALLRGIDAQIAKLSTAALPMGLYLVSTPIGNLADISIRALFVLAAATLVFCEDTRHSRKLFSAFGLHRKLEAYHDFSGERDRLRILEALRGGASVALISDAGTPLVADPGFKLVRGAIEQGLPVFPVPGPSAALAALVASGLPPDRFFFGGFLPAKESARSAQLSAYLKLPCTLVFYETPARVEATMKQLTEEAPGRSIALARELTKLHEAVLRGLPGEILPAIREDPPRGELVIVVNPPEATQATEADIRQALLRSMKSQTLKGAVEEVAKGLGVGKKMVYNLALKLRETAP